MAFKAWFTDIKLQKKKFRDETGLFLLEGSKSVLEAVEFGVKLKSIFVLKEKAEKYKKLEEGTLMRQWLADKMIPRTITLARKCIDLGHKVVIFCAYDNEIKKFREEFGDIAVYHNGKLTEKRKNKAVENFQNDNSIKVFIGNIISASVGIDLTSADVVIFNNFSFVPADNLQAEDRIHRLNQSKACTVYYQSFNDTYFDRMLEITHKKTEVIDKLIVTEKEK